MAPVLKTGVGLRPPWVRIPLPPLLIMRENQINKIWGGARVVDWGRLLSGCWVFSSTEGSNPSLPAGTKKAAAVKVGSFCFNDM